MHTPGSVTLTVFFELSAESRICDEDDIKHYYRSFLTIDLPLENKHTDDDFDAEIFKGFHADDHTLADELFNTNPRHPANDVEGVVSVVLQRFAIDWHHKPLRRWVRSEPRGHSETN